MQATVGQLETALPALITATSPRPLSANYAQVRAPTRPHPEAPNLPPFNESSLAAAKQGEGPGHCVVGSD